MLTAAAVSYLDGLLNITAFQDSTRNGLQVEGNTVIKNVGFSVDSSLEAFQEAGEKSVDFLIVHHGLIWGGLKRITSMDKARLEKLFHTNINLYSAHLPLDAHPDLGNNSRLASILELAETCRFAGVGVFGEWQTAKPFHEVLTLVSDKISRNIQYLQNSKEPVYKIAVCSGEIGLEYLEEAAREGANTILSGEGKGQSLFIHPARELGMNIIFAGHYETEVFGLHALMEKMRSDLGNELSYQWIGHKSEYMTF